MSQPSPTNAPSLRILVCGGTLDKIHCTRSEGLAFPADGLSHLPHILKEVRCWGPTVETVFLIDSLDMTDEHRATLADRVAAAEEAALVVTHGTSTMGQTARFLAARAERFPDKTVVLTGAMRPFSLAASDAGFNLGGAVIAAQSLNAGVWGVMNGRIFPAAGLNKNEELGRFDL